MIKMKKLIRSLVVALGGLFIAATASDAAGITFTPRGEQLDSDSILDIEAGRGESISFVLGMNAIFNVSVPVDSQVSINFSVMIDDPAEIQFLNNPGMLVLDYPPVLLFPSQTYLTSFSVKTLDVLLNDGMSDLSLILNSASLTSNGVATDVTNLFGGAGVKRAVDFQRPPSPVPEPGTMLCAAVALGWGAWLKRKNASQ